MEEKIFTEEELGMAECITETRLAKTSARSSRNRRMAKRFWKSPNGSENWRIRNFSSQRICAKK